MSVPKVAHARSHHRDARGVDGGDDLLVAHRAAGLDDRRGRRRRSRAGGRRRRGRRRRRRAPRPPVDRGPPPARPPWAAWAFSTAMRTASTRLIWPAPMPIVAPPAASTIALERTWRQTRHANSMSSPLRLAGLTVALRTRICSRVSVTSVVGLHELAADHGLAFDLTQRRRPLAGARAGGRSSSPSATSSASASKPGASSTSMNCLASASAQARSTRRLRAITPP